MFESIGVIDAPTFILGAFFVILCPGPNSLYVLKTSVSNGAKVGMSAAYGVYLGDSILLLATYLGVAAMLQANPAIFKVVKCGGAAYLSYLAVMVLWGTWRFLLEKAGAHELEVKKGASKKKTAEKNRVVTRMQSFRTALTLSLSNPKAILFMFSFMLPFIDASKGHPGLAFLVLALILQFWSVCYLTLLTRIGGLLLKFFGQNAVWGRVGNTLVAFIFIFFAYKLFFD